MSQVRSGDKDKAVHSVSNPLVVNGVSYIPSEALLAGISKIVLKDEHLFLILDETGSAPRIYDRELGFFFRDTRYLDTWELTINGEPTTALTSQGLVNAKSYVFTMTNRDIACIESGRTIRRDAICVRRVITLQDDEVLEQVEVTSFDEHPCVVDLDRLASSRFNDIFEVRGKQRERRGEILPPVVAADRRTVALGYAGLDGKRYTAEIASPEPLTVERAPEHGVTLKQRLRLTPKVPVLVKYHLRFSNQEPAAGGSPAVDAASLDEHLDRVAQLDQLPVLALPAFASEPGRFAKALRVAAVDIGALVTRRDGSLYPDAGIPWFCAPFGRDGLITAYQLLPWCPDVARGVLDFALARLGDRDDPFTDCEPGKVFHEMRFGEMARLKEIPFIPYYGSVDATPLALILIGEYATWTKRFGDVKRWWEPARQALEWVRGALKRGPGGFVTYKALRATGLANQGWKDSHDSVMHADGTFAAPPIALCEVQGYAYRALLAMARLARILGLEGDGARAWEDEAAGLKERFLKRFWDDERGILALALGGDGAPCRVLASNMGHALWCGIVDGPQAKAVASQLVGPELFSGHGIRTLGACEKAYNPLSYHNGSVWPHDNSIIAEGLRLAGDLSGLERLATALLGVVTEAADNRLPELYCGFSRASTGGPVPYDVACKPQAWSAGALFLLLKALLGMAVEEDDVLAFRRPLLPAPLSRLEIRGLRFAAGELDLVVRRGTISSTVEILRRSGDTGRILVAT